MATILIFSIIGVIIGIYQLYYSYDVGFAEYLLVSIMGGLIGCICGIILALALPMNTYNKKYSLNIETLQDNSSVSGNFFLGCGQISGKMKYVFYYEENGLYRMMQVDYNLVQIKYSDDKPKVNITEVYPTDAFINHFAIDFNVFDKTYIIEVPKGTIKGNYNLDAQ